MSLILLLKLLSHSGPNASLSPYLSEATNSESCFKEGPVKYHWTNHHHKRGPTFRVLMGPKTKLVRFLMFYPLLILDSVSQPKLQVQTSSYTKSIGRWQQIRVDELREFGLVFGVMLPVHLDRSSVQHRTTLSEVNVDEWYVSLIHSSAITVSPTDVARSIAHVSTGSTIRFQSARSSVSSEDTIRYPDPNRCPLGGPDHPRNDCRSERPSLIGI